jgi:hypothetical protein
MHSCIHCREEDLICGKEDQIGGEERQILNQCSEGGSRQI